MNIFFKELRTYRKGLMFWCIGMIFLVASGVAKFYGYSSTGESALGTYYTLFPHSLQVLFGLNGFNLSKPGDVYGILFMYIALAAAIHAILLSTDLISKEERDRTVEFIFAKPISRISVISAKLLAGFVNVIILNIVILITSVYVVDYFSKGTTGTNDVILLTGALFILQVLFFLIGSAIAAISKKPKATSGIASALLLVTFILYSTINLSGHIDSLRFFTPFKYFEASVILSNGHLDNKYIGLSIAIMCIMLITTYGAYNKRDLET